MDVLKNKIFTGSERRMSTRNSRKSTIKLEISPTRNTTFQSPLSTSVTPRKRSTSRTSKAHNPATPPKQIKSSENSPHKTPSTLLKHLSLKSPLKSPSQFTPKRLFNSYQNARKVLHSSVPLELPTREKELEELRTFISELTINKRSGSLYISGPPGTGKTAALSLILEEPHTLELKTVFINCTALKSSGAVYSKIANELGLKVKGKTEKDYINSINNYLTRGRYMTLLLLDEIDQLDSKDQAVLYTIFEWPSKPNSKLILIGIANSLDLTDRILPRLQMRCELKPKLMHFAPYTKQQIVQILNERLKESNSSDVFSPVALQMLAGKVASISGDFRKALDIARRLAELAEQENSLPILHSVENQNCVEKVVAVNLKQVVSVLNSVYGTSETLTKECDESFPLQQKLILCSVLLILKKARNKDISVGRLHEVYKKVSTKRNLTAFDQSEFAGLCSLLETRGIIKIVGKKEPRLHKIMLQWDEEEVVEALKDRQLLSDVLRDDSCLGKL